MFGAEKGTADRLDGKKLYYRHRAGPLQRKHHQRAGGRPAWPNWQALGVKPKHIDHVRVPGALEVPVALQALAEKDKYDALIALGCIIRGETYHFELVANESGAGVSRIALDYQLPIANAILTTENVEQAVARQTDKGRDAARVAVEMANLLDEIT